MDKLKIAEIIPRWSESSVYFVVGKRIVGGITEYVFGEQWNGERHGASVVLVDGDRWLAAADFLSGETKVRDAEAARKIAGSYKFEIARLDKEVATLRKKEERPWFSIFLAFSCVWLALCSSVEGFSAIDMGNLLYGGVFAAGVVALSCKAFSAATFDYHKYNEKRTLAKVLHHAFDKRDSMISPSSQIFVS